MTAPSDLAGPVVPPTGPASAIDVLDGAAALLRQGWVRHDFSRVVNDVLCYCLVGALSTAAAGAGDVYRLVFDAVADEVLIRGEESLSEFNDVRATSVEDVLDVIEAAKARLT